MTHHPGVSLRTHNPRSGRVSLGVVLLVQFAIFVLIIAGGLVYLLQPLPSKKIRRHDIGERPELRVEDVAPERVESPPATVPDTRPWVSGSVIDAATGQPIPGARVELLENEKRVLTAAESDEHGRYGLAAPGPRVDVLDLGVRIRARGYRSHLISPYKLVSEPIVELRVVDTLRGRVLLVDGNVARSGQVRAVRAVRAYRGSSTGWWHQMEYRDEPLESAAIQDDGTFEVEAEGPQAAVIAQVAGYAPTVSPAVEVARGDEVVIQVEVGARLRGRVTDEDGAPVAGASVTIWSLDDQLSRPVEIGHRDWVVGVAPESQVTTDARGVYEVAHIPGHRHSCLVTHPEYLDGTLEDVSHESPPDVVLLRGRVVHFQLRADGQPVEVPSVDLGWRATALPTGEPGHYAVVAQPPIMDTATVSVPGFRNASLEWPAGVGIHDCGVIELTRGKSLRVRVSRPDDPAPQGITVKLDDPRAHTYLTRNGEVTLEALSGGMASVLVDGTQHDALLRGSHNELRVALPALRAIRATVLDAAGAPVVGASVECGSVAGSTGAGGDLALRVSADAVELRVRDGLHVLDVVLSEDHPGADGNLGALRFPAVTRLHGQIRDVDGVSLPDASIQFEAWPPRRSATFTSDARGQYSVAIPRDVTYSRVRASHVGHQDKDLRDWKAEGATQQLDFELSPYRSGLCTVRYADGRPVAGAEVSVSHGDGRRTDARGDAVIETCEESALVVASSGHSEARCHWRPGDPDPVLTLERGGDLELDLRSPESPNVRNSLARYSMEVQLRPTWRPPVNGGDADDGDADYVDYDDHDLWDWRSGLVKNLEPGSYELVVSNEFGAENTELYRQTVTIRPDAVTSVAATVERLTVREPVDVQVLDPAGRPVSGAVVTVWQDMDLGYSLSSGGPARQQRVTGTSGRCTLELHEQFTDLLEVTAPGLAEVRAKPVYPLVVDGTLTVTMEPMAALTLDVRMDDAPGQSRSILLRIKRDDVLARVEWLEDPRLLRYENLAAARHQLTIEAQGQVIVDRALELSVETELHEEVRLPRSVITSGILLRGGEPVPNEGVRVQWTDVETRRYDRVPTGADGKFEVYTFRVRTARLSHFEHSWPVDLDGGHLTLEIAD